MRSDSAPRKSRPPGRSWQEREAGRPGTRRGRTAERSPPHPPRQPTAGAWSARRDRCGQGRTGPRRGEGGEGLTGGGLRREGGRRGRSGGRRAGWGAGGGAVARDGSHPVRQTYICSFFFFALWFWLPLDTCMRRSYSHVHVRCLRRRQGASVVPSELGPRIARYL
jgi:hypothetical protein